MNLLSKIQEIMSTELVTICKDDTIKIVEDLFQKHKIHHLPVIENNKLIGIVSKSDYLFFKRGFQDYNSDKKIDLFRMKKWKVADIMTSGIATLEPIDKILTALKVFHENLFHAIPIIEDTKLVGIITTHDIIEYLLKSENTKPA